MCCTRALPLRRSLINPILKSTGQPVSGTMGVSKSKVHHNFKVAFFSLISDTEAVVGSTTGDTINIRNGDPTITFGSNNVWVGEYLLCESSMTVQRTRIDGLPADKYNALIDAALKKVGISFKIPDECSENGTAGPSSGNRTRRAGGWANFDYGQKGGPNTFINFGHYPGWCWRLHFINTHTSSSLEFYV